MNLKHLSTGVLLTESSRLAAEERRITTSLLYHLAEIEFRKAYAPECRSLHEFRLFLSDEELALFREAQGLLSHRLKNPGSPSESLVKMTEIAHRELVREKTAEPARQAPKSKSAESAPRCPRCAASPLTESFAAPTAKTEPRTPPLSVKRIVFRRAGVRCERIHPDGKRCGSTFQLEIHHRVPFSQGGSSHDPANLELLCAQHHRIESLREFGDWRARKAG